VNDLATTATDLFKLGGRIADLYTRRVFRAQNTFFSQVQTATAQALTATPASKPEDAWRAWTSYATDWPQRCVLFWDTLRQRGNNFLEHERAGNPPLLAYDYETVVDGRKLARPVNYALVRITPPPDVTVDEKKRPFIIVDPRAGHGPGIGGFKQDSQVGVALKAGHPVYFVIFFTRRAGRPGGRPRPRPVRAVWPTGTRQPQTSVVGNCQGGWATMLPAASHPDVTGPAVNSPGCPTGVVAGTAAGGEPVPLAGCWGLLAGRIDQRSRERSDRRANRRNWLSTRRTPCEQVLPPVRQR
jgi:hypothetical protein